MRLVVKRAIQPLPDGRGSESVTEPRLSGNAPRLHEQAYFVVRFLFWLVMSTALEAQPVGYTINTFAGSDPVVEGGSALAAVFAQNQGLAVDPQGDVYVSDAGSNLVRKITADGLIRTVASTGLNHPYGIALDSTGRLYIANLGNQSVQRANPDGTLTAVVSQGLSAPRNLAFDIDGSLLISDFGKHQVFRYSAAGVLSVVAGTGVAGFSGDNGPAPSAQLNAPAGLAVDASGALYIADSGNNCVRKIVNGVITSVMSVGSPVAVAAAGQTVYVAGANYLGTLTTAAGTFSGVQDVALDSAGNVYYITGRQVEEIGPQGLLTVIAGSGADPYYGGDGGPATAARLNGPSALALDSAGSLYIADTLNNRIRCVSATGLMETVLDSSSVNAPQGLAVDAQDNLYIADTGNLRVLKLTPGGSVTTEVGGLSGPRALAIDSAGKLYIADAGRVLRVSGSVVSTLVAAEQAVGLAFDLDGELLVATAGGILKMTTAGVLVSIAGSAGALQAMAVTPTGDYLTAAGNQVFMDGIAIAGGVASGFAGDGGLAIAALLNSPSGLAVDSHGVIYVADTGNNRIRTLTPPPIAPLTVVNAASLAAGPIAANEIVTLFGSGFPATPEVLIGGLPAQVLYAGAAQINALVPAVTGTSAAVQVSGIAAANVAVAPVAPGLFSAILNADGTLNGPANPAPRGTVVTFYGTGLGMDLSSLTLTIGGYAAEVFYAGNAPGFVGLEQMNTQVPGGFAPVGQLVVVLNLAGAQASTTINVQ